MEKTAYDDKLYIANVGMLPETWTLENLINKHVSLPFNPNIAHTFYLAGFIESWGRGIEKIYEACKADGVPKPEYTVHPKDIMIKFTAPEDRVITFEKNKVNDSEMVVLNLLYQDPAYTYAEIAQRANISRKTVAARMKSLQKKGIVKRIGTNKKGYWNIKQ